MPKTDVVIVSKFSLEMESASGSLMFCIPYAMVQPIREKLIASFQSEQMEQDGGWLREFRKTMLQADVDINVELGRTVIKARDLVQLKTGDVIRLDKYVSEPVEVKVEGIRKFMGMPGIFKGNKAIRVVTRVQERN